MAIPSDLAAGLSATGRSFRMMLQSVVLAVGAYLVINQQASGGVIIASSILSASALAPVDLAISHWRGFVNARQARARLNKLLVLLDVPRAPTPLPTPQRGISLDDVNAAPPDVQRAVVQDVTFAFKAGNGLGVIGPSASGKSSLARVLVGLWTPARGTIRLDGATFDQWVPDELGRHIGYLPQDVELIEGTIAENISRFDPSASADAIIAAAQAAGVHDLVLALPLGYDTPIGEQGSALSAGQQQRIALARALYRDPFLVVLDEPNSNLDVEGDEALTQAILGARARGAIVVVIAHRPSALSGVDHVLALNAGRQQAFGPKDEVLAKVLRRESAPFFQKSSIRRLRGKSCPIPIRRCASIDPPAYRSGFGCGAAGNRRHWRLGGNHRDFRRADCAGQCCRRIQRQKVQHPTGGIVGEIAAASGKTVNAGDVLLRLDETMTRANLQIVSKSLDEMTARRARLRAERDGADHVSWPAEFEGRREERVVAELMADEERLFELRKITRLGQKRQLRERIAQLDEEAVGIAAQQAAKSQEIVLVQRELVGVRELWDKNLIQINRLTALEREATRLDGERAQLIAAAAQGRGKVSEIELQITQIDRELASEVGRELREMDGKSNEYAERKVAAEDQLRRIDIRAPISGTVHEMNVHTVGGVISAGEQLMLIVPAADRLTVEAKVAPQDIDQVRIGQVASLRFSAFSQRTTPKSTAQSAASPPMSPPSSAPARRTTPPE